MSQRRIIIQASDVKYASMAAVTSPAMRVWAESNGWDYTFDRLPDVDNPYRSRYQLILGLLHRYDTVMWLDTDIVPRTNRDLIYQTNKAVCASVDYNGWCAGATIWHSCQAARWIIEGIVLGTPNVRFANDQDAMKTLFAIPWVGQNVGAIPQTEINNPCSDRDVIPVMSHWWSNKDYDSSLGRLRIWADEFLNQTSTSEMSSSGMLAMQHSQS